MLGNLKLNDFNHLRGLQGLDAYHKLYITVEIDMNRTKSPSSSDSSKLLLDGEITLYHLDTAKNTGIWQCRFKNPLGKKPRYIRKSLKTKNVDIATKKAMELYTEYNTRAHLGLVRGKMTIADIWNECSHHMGRVWRRASPTSEHSEQR